MDYIGIVYEINENSAVVFTPEGKFFLVKRRMDMTLGQQVNFDAEDIYTTDEQPDFNASLQGSSKRTVNLNNIKKISLVAASLLLVFLSIRFLIFKNQQVTEQFAFIDVDINPSIEFCIDSYSTVISVKALNSDAESLISSLRLKGLSFSESFGILYQKCLSNGLIKKNANRIILVSGSLNSETDDYKKNKDVSEKKLNDTLSSARNLIEKDNVQVKLITVSPAIRQEALKNKISMGRYKVYQNANNSGMEMSIGEVKFESINFLLSIVQIPDNTTSYTFFPKITNSQSMHTPLTTPGNTAAASFSSSPTSEGKAGTSTPTESKSSEIPIQTPVSTPLPDVKTSNVIPATAAHVNNGIVSGKLYKIINKLSNKCVEVYVWSLDDGGRLSQWTYSPKQANQRWIITETGDGYYKIINQHSNKAMEVKSASTDLGATIEQSTYKGTDSQLWSIINTGDGFYKIVNKNSKKCLDVCDFSKADGANIIQWDYREINNDNQKFSITAIN